MIDLSFVILRNDDSNESYFNRQLSFARSNYEEVKTRKNGESGLAWLKRIDEYERSSIYGINIILELRGDGVDTEEKCNKRIDNFNSFYLKVFLIVDDEILNRMKKQKGDNLKEWYEKATNIIDAYKYHIFSKQDYESFDIFQKRVSKFTRVLSNIESKIRMELEVSSYKKDINEEAKEDFQDYKKEVNVKSKKEIEDYKNNELNKAQLKRQGEREDKVEELRLEVEAEEIDAEAKKAEAYNDTIFKGFMLFVYAASLCLFLALYFITPVLGYLGLIVCGGFILYLYLSEDLRRQINENIVYRFIMGAIFKFSNVTDSVLKEAGHTTIRR
jgi:hypothetical protein